MKAFQKDLLVCDFEVTGFNIETDEPIQIGLILLDKETLEPKWSYSSWIKPRMPVSVELDGFRWSSLDESDAEAVRNAPDIETVAKEIAAHLPDEYYLCAWNATFDFCFWYKVLKAVGRRAKTACVLDLWSLAQLRLLNDPNYEGDYRSESVFQYFGADPRTKHTGIGDCELEVMVLKKLMRGY